jgi:hypothetical protein
MSRRAKLKGKYGLTEADLSRFRSVDQRMVCCASGSANMAREGWLGAQLGFEPCICRSGANIFRLIPTGFML